MTKEISNSQKWLDNRFPNKHLKNKLEKLRLERLLKKYETERKGNE